jgi:hypothetical protein
LTETVDVGTNPVPVRVMLAPAVPMRTSDGATLDRTGAGFVTVKGMLLPLPVEAVPVEVSSAPICNWTPELTCAAVNVACSSVLLTSVVATGVPFTVTVVVEVNPVPVTVIATLELPAGIVVGFTDCTLRATGWLGEDGVEGDEVLLDPPHPAVKRQPSRQKNTKGVT